MARRLEDRIEIDRIDAERLQIRNARAKTLEIAAIVAIEHGPFPKGLTVRGFPRTRRAPRTRPRTRVRWIIGRVAVCEAIEHDLVPNRITRPMGRAESRLGLRLWHAKLRDIGPTLSAVDRDEPIRLADLSVGNADLPPVETPDARGVCHRLWDGLRLSAIEHQRHRFDVACKRAEPDEYRAVRFLLQPHGLRWIVFARGDLDFPVARTSRGNVKCGFKRSRTADHKHRVEAIVPIRLTYIVRRIRHPRSVNHELVGVSAVREFDRCAAEAVAHPLHRRPRGIPSVELPREEDLRFCALGSIRKRHLGPRGRDRNDLHRRR